VHRSACFRTHHFLWLRQCNDVDSVNAYECADRRADHTLHSKGAQSCTGCTGCTRVLLTSTQCCAPSGRYPPCG
jgi:hypothetical protein